MPELNIDYQLFLRLNEVGGVSIRDKTFALPQNKTASFCQLSEHKNCSGVCGDGRLVRNIVCGVIKI